MKIAFTADLHLRNRKDTPERYRALEYILNDLTAKKISELIIAGDAFDRDFFNYSDFNDLCSGFSNIRITIFPGNHDVQISKKYFPPQNLEVINEPVLKQYGDIPVLILPYHPVKLMDEALTEFFYNNNLPERWLLTGHGDYCTTTKDFNPYEPGIYMPLSGSAVNKFNPLTVILGHIHKPSETGRIIYPGSPCPVDINETGKRRYLIFDTSDNSIEKLPVKTDIIYFNETLISFPAANETRAICDAIDMMIKNWKLDNNEKDLVKLRLKIKGFTSNLTLLKESVIKHLKDRGIVLYDENGPDLKEVNVIKEADDDRVTLLKKTIEKINHLKIEADRGKILEKIQELIFTVRR